MPPIASAYHSMLDPFGAKSPTIGYLPSSLEQKLFSGPTSSLIVFLVNVNPVTIEFVIVQ